MAEEKPKRVSIKQGKGTFYISSKTNDGEGYVEQIVSKPNSEEKLTRYHKELSLKGYLNYVGVVDFPQGGLHLSIIIGGKDESYSVNLPIYSPKGVKSINDYTQSIIGALENVNKGDKITMFVNNKNKDKNGYFYKNILILDQDDKLVKSNYQFGDIPKWTFTEEKDELTGKSKKVWDASPTNKFFIDKIKAITEKFAKTEAPKEEAHRDEEHRDEAPTNEAPKQEKEVPLDLSEDDYDDLPF